MSIFVACLFFCLAPLSGQSPYTLNKKQEIYFLAGGTGAVGIGTYLFFETTPLTLSEISNLNSKNINVFDGYASEKYSEKIKNLSDGLLAASFIAPLPLIFDKRIQNDFWKLSVLYAEAATATVGATLLAKALTERPRPLVYNSNVPLDKKNDRSAKHSFFSGHTSLAAMNSFFFAKIFNDYNPDSKLKPYVWTGAILLPIATGIARIESGKHFPTDVLAGYITGAAAGYLIPYFHSKKRKHSDFSGVSFLPFFGGFSVRITLD